MRKVKRFAAIVLTAALLSPATAYAGNVEDAKALYEQVTEKQKSITDMNAYYDYQIHLSGSALEGIEDAGNMRMEMNVRMNHLTDMGNLQYSSYSRMTMPGQTSDQRYVLQRWDQLYGRRRNEDQISYGSVQNGRTDQQPDILISFRTGAGRTADGFPFMDRRG